MESMVETTLFTTDTNEELINKETEFLSNASKFIPLTNWWNVEPKIIPQNVLYSRITNQHYVLRHEELTVEELCNVFEDSGHTIGIDYRKSFVRYLAFDIDCMCRKIEDTTEHNTAEKTKLIALKLTRLLFSFGLLNESQSVSAKLQSDMELIKTMDKHCAIWENGCGFHLYTSFTVSLTVHQYILNALKASLTDFTCNIEIPSIMPLPYSAKQINVSYKPIRALQYTPKLAILSCESVKFHDNTLILPANAKPDNAIKILTVTMSNNKPSQNIWFNNAINLSSCVTPPVFPNLFMIGKVSNIIGIDNLYNYIMDMSSLLKTNQVSDNGMDIDDDDEPLDVNQQYDIHLSTNFKNFKSNNVSQILNSFFVVFNRNFIDPKEVCADTNYFVSWALDCGCLYLQHAVIMLHYWIIEHSDNMEFTRDEIVKYLREIFTERIIQQCLCLNEFLKHYSLLILYAYKTTSIEMITHFAYLKSYQITPFMDLTDMLLSIMAMRYGHPDAFLENISSMKKPEKELLFHKMFTFYCNALDELGVVLINAQTNNAYILVDRVYLSESTKPQCPNILMDYITDRSNKYSAAAIIQRLRLKRKAIDPKLLFTKTELQFQTSIGSFNSITGLYSSHCKFLRFSRRRDFAIWHDPFEHKLTLSEDQNLKCLELRMWTRDFYVKMPNYINDLYLQFAFIPAIFHVGQLPSISEKNIGLMSKLILEYENLPLSASFFVEYYKIHPLYIYVVSWIYVQYDGFITLSDYNTLQEHIFQHKDTIDWYEFLLPLAKTCTYNKNEELHQTILSSISDDKTILNLNELFVLQITIFSLLLTKCNSFGKFNQACAAVCNTIDNGNKCEDLSILCKIDKSKIPMEYADLVDKMSSITCRSQLIDIYKMHLQTTKQRVFSNISTYNLSFDRSHHIRDRIIDTAIVISMSCFFNSEIMENLIDCFSLLFLTKNVKKKFIVLFGESNTGKSALCKMIKLMQEPYAGMFNNFDQASNRANVNTMYNCVIINEANSLDGNLLKSHTGNDGESAIQFFSTTYETRDTQALLYGATNTCIKFKNSKNQMIDRVTIDRLHAVTLTGKQIEDDNTNVTDFLHMLINNLIFKYTISLTDDNISSYAICMAMLSFVNYTEKRSARDYMPALNVDIPSSLNYRNETFKLNNKLYEFLLNLGFQRETNFYINKPDLLRVVYRAMTRAKKNSSSKSSMIYSNMTDFFIDFKQEFNVDLNVLDNVVIDGIQEYGLIQHIKDNLRVQTSTDSVITEKQLEDRINYMFNSNNENEFVTNKDNARFFMHRMNIEKYDSELKQYRNVAFVQDTTTYVNGETTTLAATASSTASTSSNSSDHNVITSPMTAQMSVDDLV